MGSLPKSLERTMCFALIQWMGITTTLPRRHPPVDAGLPYHESSLAPSLATNQGIFHTHTHTHLPCQPDVLRMYEHLPSESKIPTHSTHSIFATLRDNGPFEMMMTMPRRQTMSCVQWGCIAWDGITITHAWD